ncbi:MAG: hypothetical protein L6Q97_21840 [Thermoanaerobaculia bacterium]|nr:hypothetical protein [Thermoanaerobaculia bacterium]
MMTTVENNGKLNKEGGAAKVGCTAGLPLLVWLLMSKMAANCQFLLILPAEQTGSHPEFFK